MYSLKIEKKQLSSDDSFIEAECSLYKDDVLLKKGIGIKATVESFEQTAEEVGERLARSFDAMDVIPEEIEVDLVKIDKKRSDMREQEAIVASQQIVEEVV